MSKNVVIVAACRTPIGSFMGTLSSIPATQLTATAIKGALQKIELDPALVDEIILGQVLQAGCGQAPTRQAAIFAGLSEYVVCTTINKVCASGMKSIMMAAQSIQCGDADIIIAGGMENMSVVPHYAQLRSSTKFGTATLIDGLQKDGLSDAYDNDAMGIYADLCASKYDVSREDQDAYAIQSYLRSATAWKDGKFDNEVIPVAIPQKKAEPILIYRDEEFSNCDIEKIPHLNPAFSKDGTATAANSSTISDGAAALILMSEEKALFLGLTPLASIKSYADAAQDPKWFTTSPAIALTKALQKANLSIAAIDFFEVNEAFAVVSLVNSKLLGIENSKINVFGGAISLGHPLGCSGARIIVTLLNVLEQNNGKFGAAAICNGGGGASAIIIEKY